MPPETGNTVSGNVLFPLPCACQNLRRLARVVSRLYDEELRKAGLEITQFGLLTALATLGVANQKTLSTGLAMDSTTLTRTLGPMCEAGWVRVRRGEDRRERRFRLTPEGKRRLALARPHWEQAERTLRRKLGDASWNGMADSVHRLTQAAIAG